MDGSSGPILFAVLLALIKLARPKDWLKNAFVLLPFPFAIAGGAGVDFSQLLLGVCGFSLVASAVYALNDARDAERDRLHEKKRHRPVASGAVSVTQAYIFSAVLVAMGIFLGSQMTSERPVLLFCTYFGLQVAYSMGAKHIPVLDVFLLSSGFLIRVLLGCAILGVQASNWLLLCGSALALFIGLAKRRGDLVKGLDDSHRPVLAGYNLDFLEQSMAIICGTTVLSYALYCLESTVWKPGFEFASLPFVVFGMLDYLRNAHVHRAGGSPVDLLLRSPALIAAGIGWFVAIGFSISWG